MSETFTAVDSWPQVESEVWVAWLGAGWYVVFHYVEREGYCCMWCDQPPLMIGRDVRLEQEPGGWRIRGTQNPETAEWDSKVHPEWVNQDLGLITGLPDSAPWLQTPVLSEDVVHDGSGPSAGNEA